MPFKTFKDTCTWHGVELGQAGRAWKAHVSEFWPNETHVVPTVMASFCYKISRVCFSFRFANRKKKIRCCNGEALRNACRRRFKFDP